MRFIFFGRFDLLAAIDSYLEDNALEDADFTEEDTLDIADEFVDGGTYEVTYNVPVKPIVITADTDYGNRTLMINTANIVKAEVVA